ncbi:hypothetical protein G6F31_018768 [Rhizopus arrhizus]|nr:hypothetical protein G6F31_018768 [Rhizopus arrhizus]
MRMAGKPASAVVGMSGALAMRLSHVVASAVSLPLWISGSVTMLASEAIGSTGRPVASFTISATKCGVLPLPAVENVMRSVLAFLARSTKSFKSLAGLDGLATMTDGVMESSATGVSASSL